jgi:hypothetical protein
MPLLAPTSSSLCQHDEYFSTTWAETRSGQTCSCLHHASRGSWRRWSKRPMPSCREPSRRRLRSRSCLLSCSEEAWRRLRERVGRILLGAASRGHRMVLRRRPCQCVYLGTEFWILGWVSGRSCRLGRRPGRRVWLLLGDLSSCVFGRMLSVIEGVDEHHGEPDVTEKRILS